MPQIPVPVEGATADNAVNPTTKVAVLSATSTAAAPTFTEGRVNPLSTDLSGRQRVDSSAWIGSTAPTVGQKTMANSLPVALASDQPAVPTSEKAPGTTPFAIQHQPAVATQATISQAAAGVGVRNVCTGFTVTLSSTAAPTAGSVIFNLRDGASGAGTILWSGRLSIPAAAGNGATISLGGIWIQGTANTAMTLESAAAPSANTFATVAMIGTTA